MIGKAVQPISSPLDILYYLHIFHWLPYDLIDMTEQKMKSIIILLNKLLYLPMHKKTGSPAYCPFP
jgi:hypothetical protein